MSGHADLIERTYWLADRAPDQSDRDTLYEVAQTLAAVLQHRDYFRRALEEIGKQGNDPAWNVTLYAKCALVGPRSDALDGAA